MYTSRHSFATINDETLNYSALVCWYVETLPWSTTISLTEETSNISPLYVEMVYAAGHPEASPYRCLTYVALNSPFPSLSKHPHRFSSFQSTTMKSHIICKCYSYIYFSVPLTLFHIRLSVSCFRTPSRGGGG
jgi:hypothetical protein